MDITTTARTISRPMSQVYLSEWNILFKVQSIHASSYVIRGIICRPGPAWRGGPLTLSLSCPPLTWNIALTKFVYFVFVVFIIHCNVFFLSNFCCWQLLQWFICSDTKLHWWYVRHSWLASLQHYISKNRWRENFTISSRKTANNTFRKVLRTLVLRTLICPCYRQLSKPCWEWLVL